jgi:hypothetical protein
MLILIPAHHEEASSGTMLNALLAQTRVPDRVVVIADRSLVSSGNRAGYR